MTKQQLHKHRGRRGYYSIHIAEQPYKLILKIERKKVTDEKGEVFTFRLVEIIRCVGGRKKSIGSFLLNKKLIYEENRKNSFFSRRDSMSLNGTLYLIPNKN